MNFPDRSDVQGYVLQIFKRIHNSFPANRQAMEGPLLKCCDNILKQWNQQHYLQKEELHLHQDENLLMIKDPLIT